MRDFLIYVLTYALVFIVIYVSWGAMILVFDMGSGQATRATAFTWIALLYAKRFFDD